MRSSRMTARFRPHLVLTALVGAVVVFHGASFAQQSDAAPTPRPATGEVPATSPQAPAPQPAAPQPPAPQSAPQAVPPQVDQQIPPDYGPPPGYRPSSPYYGQPRSAPGYYDSYGYPPPRYYRSPRYYQGPGPSYPPGVYPAPTSYRSFFFGFGLGIGGVGIMPHMAGQMDDMGYTYENASRAGLGYTLRLGFGVSPRWSLVLAADGATAYFNGYSVTQTAWTIGPQVFLNRQVYLRGGVGVANYSQSYDDGYYYYSDPSDSGMAVTAAVGFEFLQSYHTSMGLELAGSMGWFPNKDRVGTVGLNFVLNLF